MFESFVSSGHAILSFAFAAVGWAIAWIVAVIAVCLLRDIWEGEDSRLRRPPEYFYRQAYWNVVIVTLMFGLLILVRYFNG